MHDDGSELVAPVKRAWLLVLLVVAVTGGVYANSLRFDFVYDDLNQIVSNPTIQSWRYLPSVVTGHVWGHKTSTVLYYRPVFTLWLLGNYTIFGSNAAWWHFSTVALHLLATVLVYVTSMELGLTAWVSVVASLLFGLFPAHVEAVDWVSGVSEPLFAILLIATFLCFLRGRQQTTERRLLWFWASLPLFAICMLSKETAVAFPGSVLAYEWFVGVPAAPVRKRARIAAAAALPYILIGGACLILRTFVLKTFAQRSQISLSEMLFTWPGILMFYVRHLLAPIHLSAFYNFGLVSHPGIKNFAVPLLLIILIAGMAGFLASRSRIVGFLGLWMLLFTLPLLSLMVFGKGELVHDRYLYAPSIAFCMLLAMALEKIPMQPVRLALAAAVCCAYATGTVYEGHFWADGLLLNQRGLAVAPGNTIAIHNLGVQLMMRDRRSEAIPYFLQTLEREPDSEETLFALGLCYFDSDLFQDAERYLRRATAANPLDPKAHLFLGIARARQGHLDEGEREIRRSIELQRVPAGYKRYHLALGAVLQEKGDFAGALKEYRLELDNDPDSDAARQGIASTRAMLRLSTRR